MAARLLVLAPTSRVATHAAPRRPRFSSNALGAESFGGATQGWNEVAYFKWRLGKEETPGYAEGRTTVFLTK